MIDDDLEQLANRAKELEAKHDLQGALDCHIKILEMHEDDLVIVFNAHGYIADLYVKMGRPADAQRHLEAAIAMNPNDEAYLYALGQALGMQGRYADAAEAYGTAAELAPQIPELHRARGAALLAADSLAEAEAAFLTAYHRDPTHTATLAGLVAVLAKKGQLDEAERLLQIALESAPDDPMLTCAKVALDRLRLTLR